MNKHILWFPLSCSLTLLLPNCGGSDDDSGAPSAAEIQATCKNSCAKTNECLHLTQDCEAQCPATSPSSGAGGSTSAPSCDYAKLKAKVDECLAGSCDQLLPCLGETEQICPRSSNGSGGGPPTGTGGVANPGAGGTPAGAGGSGPVDMTTCAACDAASACCVKVTTQAGQPSAGCDAYSKASCEASAQKAALIQSCATFTQACP